MARRPRVDLVLAGDIGGTNARLRLYDVEAKKKLDEKTFASQSFPSLAAVLGPYVESAPGTVLAAVLGIAGPVVDGVSRTTNLPWVVDERKLSRTLDVPAVRLVNDLAAVAIGCTRLRPKARMVLAEGEPPKQGNAAVISAGTGLGEALLVWDGMRFVPAATEGGHCDFAPADDTQAELLRYLRKCDAKGHVSWERVLSGPGMGNVYDFFRDRSGRRESAEVEQELAQGDRNATITRLGLAGKSEAAMKAVDTFAAIYGAEAGNLALKGLATRGVYVCGRIAGEVIPARKQVFLDAMRDKGRLRPLVESMPIYLVQEQLVGIVGAAFLAAELAAAGF